MIENASWMSFGQHNSLPVRQQFIDTELSSTVLLNISFSYALTKGIVFSPLISTGESTAERKTKKKRYVSNDGKMCSYLSVGSCTWVLQQAVWEGCVWKLKGKIVNADFDAAAFSLVTDVCIADTWENSILPCPKTLKFFVFCFLILFFHTDSFISCDFALVEIFLFLPQSSSGS